jgi:filamentous hemagglutinin family protein
MRLESKPIDGGNQPMRTISGRVSKRLRARPDAPSSHGPGQRLAAHLTLIAFVLGSGPGTGWATETALGNVTAIHGEGEFTVNTDAVTEFSQQSPHAILDWQTDFQQPASHSLEFRQDAGFVVLNQSPGERASDFWGRVVCDATCIFANRAGINFQDGSFVDVGQVIAAAGDLSHSDFLAGQYRFTGLDGRVTNAGHMQGQGIALLGRSVANFGHVETPNGSFVMAAGNEIQLRDHNSPIVIQSSLGTDLGAPDDLGGGPAVENAGTIEAGNGRVRLAAGDMLSFAIRNTGSIHGGSITLEAGEGGGVEVRGVLDTADRGVAGPEGETQGGDIDVFGDFVSIQAGALLDASGAGGGGRIRVGGEFQGGDGAPTARGTYVHATSELRADATERGNGGEIIVWADEIAQVYGTLSATGGPLGGSGGFAETSGKQWLDITRAPNLRALSGAPGDLGGDWLIDPNNITIVAAGCDQNDPACLDAGLSQAQIENPLFQLDGGPVVRPTVNDSEIQAGLISGALEQGVSVTILTDTIATEQGNQNGDITVLAAITPDATNASPGSRATLSLLAANHLIVNEAIGVVADPNADPTAASNLVLSLALRAGDLSQNQNPLPADEIPNAYVGNLEINADINSGAGAVVLDGINVIVEAGTTITTDGGTLAISSFAGNITLGGAIDTTTATRDDEGNELFGGAVAVFGEAIRVPNSGAAAGESLVIGGDIVVAGSVNTDGGTIALFTTGGNVDVAGSLDTSVVEAPDTPVAGGNIEMRARRTEFPPLSSQDAEALTAGGGITVAEGARLVTGGGDVSLGLDATSSTASAYQIVVNGQIDSTGAADAVGGAVTLVTADEGASVTIADLTPTDLIHTSIVTAGGRIQSVGSGSLRLEDATLDARSLPGLDPDFAVSDIGFFHAGDVDIVESTGTTLLAADQAIQIAPGLQIGTGNITFSGAPEIIGEEVLLSVGDGFGGDSTETSIALGAADFHSHGGLNAAPLRFSLLQEADFTLNSTVLDRIAGGNLAQLEQLTLAASDGSLIVDTGSDVPGVPGALSAPGPNLELRLSAGAAGPGAIVVVDGVVARAFSPDSLALLQLELEQGFTVDADLADSISGAARDLIIRAGTPAVAEDPSLLIQGSLSASESIVLHAGTQGEGDLAFAQSDPLADPAVNPITLTAPSLTLRAGDGDSAGSAAVRSETLAPPSVEAPEGANVLFSSGNASALTAFTLRQDAAIDDTTVPDPDRFIGGVAGVNYTLRSDGTSGGITLGDDGAAGVLDTQLSLHALEGIDLSGITEATETLRVRSLDIGGLGAFTYTQALNEKVSFTDPASDPGSSRLVVRAGLVNPGTLSFEGDMTLKADEIRLVAGDGVGGNAGDFASSVDLSPSVGAAPIFQSLSPGTALEFVFRQDAGIENANLPLFTENFGGIVPGRLAIRSDDGGIALSVDGTSALPLLQASEQLVLSAPTISLSRSDGQDLVVDDVLQAGPGPLDLQFRTGGANFSAVNSEGTTDEQTGEILTDAAVLPGSLLRLAAFDFDETAAPGSGLVPAAFDFDVVPADAPGLISIDQDGDLLADPFTDPLAAPGPQNFIDPGTQLGLAGNAALNQVFFTSRHGSITLTPSSVSGSDLTLSLESSDFVDDPFRSIRFDGAAFDLDSLIAVNPFGWLVERATNPGGEVDLSLRTEGVLQLRAGLLGTGNLDFAGDVVLDAQTLVLSAGDDPLLPIYPDAPASESLPVVNVRDANGDPAVTLQFHELENVQTALQIRQHGSLVDSDASAVADALAAAVAALDPEIPEELAAIEALRAQDGWIEGERSLIPLMSQLEVVDTAGDPTRLNQIQLESIAGDIRIHRMIDFSDPVNPLPALNANNILLGAGLGPDATNTIRLEQNDGHDLDLSPESNDFAFDSFVIFGPRIEFVTTSTSTPTLTLAGVIKAENPDLLLLGATTFDTEGNFLPASPAALLFEQTASFNESAGDCALGCLPNPVTQLGPSGAGGVDYTIRTVGALNAMGDLVVPGGSILIDGTLSNKLTFSALTLDAFASGTGTDVIIEASPLEIDFDLILESLTVGTDSTAPIGIFLSGSSATSENSELAILTLNDQTFNGEVTLDGRAELAGRVVHITGAVNAADAGQSDELVVAVRSQALLDGNVGENSELELLRINFDPSAVADAAQLPTLGLGGDADGPTTVRARTIEILNAGDLEQDIEIAHVPRAALASTIFKKTGDLEIIADNFSMGEGEKLSVGGNLSITTRTPAGDGLAALGDLSALEIRVDADTIEIQRRAPGEYIDSSGIIRPDGGVDYVANFIDFQGTIELVGTGANPVFGIPDPQSIPAWMLPFSTFQSQVNAELLTTANLAIPPDYISLADLHPQGGSRDDPSTMFIESEVVPLPVAWVAAPWLPINHASVEELGIDVQPMSVAEYMSQLRGATLIDDVGQGLTPGDGRPLRVSDARIEGTEAARAVALLNELLGPQRGRALRVRIALQNALDQYLRTSGARRVVGFELRRFVKNRPSSLFAAYKALEDLDLLFALHRGLGLTPGEYRPIQASWLKAIRPEGITTRELAEAIQPSRYVRGSDVLDIFGE